MGKKKDNTVWKTKPETQEVKDLKNFRYEKDPRLPFIFANRKQDYAESYDNPLGAYTTPMVRDQAVRANNAKLDQEYAAASAAENAQSNNIRLGQLTSIADRMSPQLVQKTGGFNWGAALGAAAGIGTGLMTAGAGTPAATL